MCLLPTTRRKQCTSFYHFCLYICTSLYVFFVEWQKDPGLEMNTFSITDPEASKDVGCSTSSQSVFVCCLGCDLFSHKFLSCMCRLEIVAVLVSLSFVVLVCCVPGVIWRQAATDGWFSIWQCALHLLLLTPCHE